MKTRLLLVLLAACGSGTSATSRTTPNADALDGARLIGIGNDGNKLTDPKVEPPSGQFFDRELNAECSFAPVSETEFRCLTKHGCTSLFANADCSTPVFTNPVSSCGAAMPDLVTTTGAPLKDELLAMWFAGPVKLYKRGATIARPMQLFRKVGDSCRPTENESVPPEDAVFYALAPQDVSTFAEAKFYWQDGSNHKLQQATLELAQGLKMTDYFWLEARDPNLSVICSLEDGKTCAPSFVSLHNAYTDATCTTAHLGAQTWGEPAKIGSVDNGKTLQRLTYKGTQRSFSRDDEAMCFDDGEYDLFEPGELVQAQRAEKRAVGNDYVVKELRVFADGLNWLQGHQDWNERLCDLEVYAKDGTTRCVPSATWNSYPTHFLDADCKIQVAATNDPDKSKTLTAVKDNECDPHQTIRRLGQQLPEQFVGYVKDSYGRCMKETRDYYTYTLLGDEVPASEFSEIR